MTQAQREMDEAVAGWLETHKCHESYLAATEKTLRSLRLGLVWFSPPHRGGVHRLPPSFTERAWLEAP